MHAKVAYQLVALFRVNGIERERNAVAGQHVAQLMGARLPSLADDAVDHVARTIGLRPRTQRLLHLRVEPLFGGGPPLRHPEVDPPERSRALKRFKFAEGNVSMVLVHLHHQHTNYIPVQRPRSLEELDPIHAWQSEVGCHERHVVALLSQPLEEVEPGLGRALGYHAVVGTVAPSQRALEDRKLPRVVVDNEQDWVRHTCPLPLLRFRPYSFSPCGTLGTAAYAIQSHILWHPGCWRSRRSFEMASLRSTSVHLPEHGIEEHAEGHHRVDSTHAEDRRDEPHLFDEDASQDRADRDTYVRQGGNRVERAPQPLRRPLLNDRLVQLIDGHRDQTCRCSRG